VPDDTAPRTLILLAKRPRPGLAAQIAAGDEPRVEYLELAHRLGAEILDYDSVEASSSPLVRWLDRRLGAKWALAWMGFARRREFDHLYATGEDVGIPLTLFLRAARCYGKLTVVMHRSGTPKRRLLLRVLGSRVYHHLICLNAVQRQLLIEQIGLDPDRVVLFHTWIDHRFFQPLDEQSEAGDYILSVGMEGRDYDTLQAAARLAGRPVRIVTSGWSPGAGSTTVAGVSEQGNLTVLRGLSYLQLRDLYAGARFVVVPLRSACYAAGVTGILEAMAMGKAVVVSASPGVMDYVENGVTGRIVPVGDPRALAAAITDCWQNPGRMAGMGTHNRRWVENGINAERYVAQVADLLGVASPRHGTPETEDAGRVPCHSPVIAGAAWPAIRPFTQTTEA
jgi:glycosyltransferase involved in cell wall biosynthesis